MHRCEITDVIEDGDILAVEADYGCIKGNPANIFIDIIPKPNNMETNNSIQFIDFAPSSRSLATKPNEALIYSRGKRSKEGKGTYQMRIPCSLHEVVKNGYCYLRIAVNNLTNETFAVLDKSEGVKIIPWDKVYRISNVNLVKWLENRLGLPKNGGGVIKFSENLSRNGGYTYRMETK